MEITIIDKSALIGEKINFNSIVFRLHPVEGDDKGNITALWPLLVTIVRGGAVKVLLDMQDVDFIDSRGIGIIINSAKHLRTIKGDIVLINISEKISRIFDVLNINRIIKVFDSEEDAMHHLKFI
ncbi:MAG TPA: STAS domain-containing protein [Spirochaetota bacterium]|nr:STAS domain-containing protein [Spirochaetota bacterium]HRZ28038.1 STAS domain-containing protein [Spirochaetota bacterium]HSA15228.1 STAS domain-containing protein [Spirochaetota bacterium]